VRWTQNGERHVHATADATEFVRELFAHEHPESGPISELEVRRPSLESTYLSMVADERQEAIA
jgi:ABC-2 type transport system ATP-binding protein